MVLESKINVANNNNHTYLIIRSLRNPFCSGFPITLKLENLKAKPYVISKELKRRHKTWKLQMAKLKTSLMGKNNI